MNDELDYILDDCLSRLQAGENIESVLQTYPQHAAELRPLLQTAKVLQTAPRPASRLVSARLGRRKMLATASAKYPARPVSKPAYPRYAERITNLFTGKDMPNMKRTYRFALITLLILAVVLAVGGGVTVASASSVPGDALYPVKTTVDDVRLFLTINPDTHQQLEQQIQQTRYNDITVAMHNGRIADVHFWGELSSFDASQWVVGGLTVNLDANTQIAGTPVLGAFVRVAAVTQPDGSLLAKRLVVVPMLLPTASATVTEVTGTVTAYPTPKPFPTFPPFPTYPPFPTFPPNATYQPYSTVVHGTPFPVTPPIPPMHTPGAIRTLIATFFPTGFPTGIPTHQPIRTVIATYIATFMPTPHPTHQPIPTHEPLPTMIATYRPTATPVP